MIGLGRAREPRQRSRPPQSLFARFASRQESSYAGKRIAALRKEFGGHAVRTIEDHAEEASEEQ
jgi:hypothetical protein